MTLWQVVSYIGVIGIVILAFMNPRGFVINVARIIVFPLILLLKVFIVAFQRMHRYHLRDGEIRLTLMLVIILKFRTLILYLVKFITDTFNDLVGEEMLKISTTKTISYVPVEDRGSEVETSFQFRSIPAEKVASYQDQTLLLDKKGQAKAYQMRTTRLRTTREMLVGWTNFGDEDGNPVKFDANQKNLMYDMLGADLQKELEERFGEGSLNWEAVEAEIAEKKAKADAEAADSYVAPEGDDE